MQFLSDASGDDEEDRPRYERRDVPTKRQEEVLRQLYYTQGFAWGRNHLYNYMKNIVRDSTITKRAIMHWLNRQELHQIYRSRRGGRRANMFIPSQPYLSMSVDLLDYSKKVAPGNLKYVFVAIDNFSRFMHTETMFDKTSVCTAKAFTKILSKLPKKPKYIICDRGHEFMHSATPGVLGFLELCKQERIHMRMTIGGAPEQNGLVERANRKVKMLMAKRMALVEGSRWWNCIKKATELYNDTWNFSTGFRPKDAVLFTTQQQFDTVLCNVLNIMDKKRKYAIQAAIHGTKEERLPIGTVVRHAVTKKTLSKESDGTWSRELFKIVRVIESSRRFATEAPTIPNRYIIVPKDTNDNNNNNNDDDDLPDKYFMKSQLMVVDEDTMDKIEDMKKYVDAPSTRRRRDPLAAPPPPDAKKAAKKRQGAQAKAKDAQALIIQDKKRDVLAVVDKKVEFGEQYYKIRWENDTVSEFIKHATVKKYATPRGYKKFQKML